MTHTEIYLNLYLHLYVYVKVKISIRVEEYINIISRFTKLEVHLILIVIK